MKSTKPFLFLMLGLMLFSFAQTASAQDCAAPVVDQARMFKNDIADINSAIADFHSTGNEVYVRTFDNFGNAANVEKLTRQLLAACPAWQNAKGDYRSNVVILVFTIEKHAINFAAGDNIDQPVPSSERAQISKQYIAPKFRDGNFAGGVVAGIGRLKQLLSQSQSAAPARSEPTVVIQPVQQTAPTDFSGLWKVLRWLTVVGLLFLALFVGVRFYNEKERRRGAQTKAKTAKAAAASRVNELPTTCELLLSRARSLSGKGIERVAQLASRLQGQKQSLETATATFSDLSRDSGSLDQLLSVQEFDNARASFQELVISLNSVSVEFSDIDSKLSDIEGFVKKVPLSIEKARSSMDTASTDIEAMAAHGYKVSPYLAKLDMARTKLDEAQQLFGSGKCDQAIDSLAQANALIGQACKAKDLPKTESELATQIAGCESRASSIGANVLAARDVFGRLEAGFAEASWRPVRGNGSQATEHLNWCAKALPLARQAIGKDVQDWQRAGEIVSEANEHLDRAASLVSSIASMEQNLSKAKAESANEVEAAEQALDGAYNFSQTYINDLEASVVAQLPKARALLTQAKAELGQDRPEYFMVLKLVKQSHSLADDILVKFRSSHDQAERNRQKAKSALRDATSRVGTAREYLEDHSRYVPSSARDLLTDAQSYLSRAQAASLPLDIINWAEKADAAAEQAQKNAKRKVDEAYDHTTSYSSRSTSVYAPSQTTVLVGDWGLGRRSDDYQSPVAVESPSNDSSSDWSSSSGGSDSSFSVSDNGGSDSSSSW